MGSRFMNSTFLNDQDDSENSPENSGDSPRSTMLNDSSKMSTCVSSPKRSRRSIQKRVISVPIKDVEGSRLKGEMGAPPSDSWAWRKYGQKPIKGSPYPRGYYRCSSSKGCPARKQVERSRLDPTTLMVTYTCEHNHPWPAPRNNHHHHHHQNHNAAAASTTTGRLRKVNAIQTEPTNSEGEEVEELEEDQKPTSTNAANSLQPQAELIKNNCDDQKFGNLGEASLSEYGCCSSINYWFSDLECTSSTTLMLESPLLLCDQDRVTDADMAMVFTMRDEDESFFADLGELPECSTVFRHGMIEREEEHRRHNLAPWCGTTG